jgi:hypothetical protein
VSWTFLYLMVALKVPIVGLFLIVRWAIKQTPEEAGDGSGGGNVPTLPKQPHHRRRLPPRHPRRGPHGGAALTPPPRVRSVTARGRELADSHF